MKLSCLQDNLSRGLGVVGRAVATRSTLPITSHVLLAAGKSQLKLTATNLEIAISCDVSAMVEEEGAITVPARLVTDFVNSLPSERIDLDLSPRPRTLHLQCARFEARISGMNAEEFPPIPQISDGLDTRIASDLLRTALSQVVFAAATEDSRPVLTGVQADFDASTLTLAAADGFRLAVHRLPLASPVKEKLAVIIPARSLAELNRLLGDEAEAVEVSVDKAKSRVRFRLQNVEIVSQLIQGTFPKYEQLIPSKSTTKTVVDTAEFLRAARSASIFARDASGIVRLEATPDKLRLSAQAEEVGDNSGEIDAQVEGEPAKIAFNAKYLLDVLGVLEKGQIALETTTPSSPGVLKPVGQDNYIHVVMPMFVQW